MKTKITEKESDYYIYLPNMCSFLSQCYFTYIFMEEQRVDHKRVHCIYEYGFKANGNTPKSYER